MGKSYYTRKDIEDFAAAGITRLEMGPHVVITDVGRDLAEELRIELVMPGATQTPTAFLPPPPSHTTTTLGTKPRGCQHGPLTLGITAPTSHSIKSNFDKRDPDGVVNKLVDIVKRLGNQGG